MAVDYDVAIIGAGAAGIAAARQLTGSNHSVILLEASQRIGGRAWTQSLNQMPLDIGCGWLHSARRNPLVPLGEAAGLTIEKGPSAWGEQWGNLGFSAREQTEASSVWERFMDRLRRSPPQTDMASDALEADSPWNPYCHAMSGYLNGVELNAVSVTDFLAYDIVATDDNWRAHEGYGNLISLLLPERVSIRFSTPVRSVKRSAEGVEIDTSRGRFRCRTAIVTVATDVLARSLITFDEAVDDHIQAASRLPLGHAEKIFIELKGDHGLEAETHLIGDPRGSVTGSYYIRPLGRPVIEGFFGGNGAVLFKKNGLQDIYSFALDELAALLGESIRRRTAFLAASQWSSTDWIYGSYSHALPGHADARGILAKSVDDRIFFAGEATHQFAFSTAHGAWESGVRAAGEVMAALRCPSTRT
jgi:monoamine oxidase